MLRTIRTMLVVSFVAAAVAAATPAGAAPGDSKVGDLRDRLAAAERSLADAHGQIDLITSQRDVALQGRNEARAQIDDAFGQARAWRYTAYVVLGIAVLAWSIGAARRRNTIRVRLPDTVDDLLREADDTADH